MWALISVPFFVLWLVPEEPCGFKARQSALGQAARQLLVAMDFSQAQIDRLESIQHALKSSTTQAALDVENARQELLDGFLAAVEDGDLSSVEQDELSAIQTRGRNARRELIAIYQAALKNILRQFTPFQHERLASFVPKILLEEEVRADAGELLAAFKLVKTHYMQGGPELIPALAALEKTVERTRFTVYIPPWVDLQIDAIYMDFHAYKPELLKAAGYFKPVDEASLTQADRMLDDAVQLLARAVALAKTGLEPKGGAPQNREKIAGFNQTLLVTPVFQCLLADL